MTDNTQPGKMTISIDDETVEALKQLHGIDALAEVSSAIKHELDKEGRRVFYVDVGNLSPEQAQTVLDSVKTDMQTRAIPSKKYYSTKKIGPISTGHRQWKDDKHCKFAHGYGRYVQFTFECDELDHRSWVVDFGGLKEAKKWLEEQWDHRMLIASDDPLLPEFEKMHDLGGINLNVMDVTKGYGPGIEASCNFVYDYVNPMIEKMTNGRCRIKAVEIWEHEFNTARLEIDY